MDQRVVSAAGTALQIAADNIDTDVGGSDRVSVPVTFIRSFPLDGLFDRSRVILPLPPDPSVRPPAPMVSVPTDPTPAVAPGTMFVELESETAPLIVPVPAVAVCCRGTW